MLPKQMSIETMIWLVVPGLKKIISPVSAILLQL